MSTKEQIQKLIREDRIDEALNLISELVKDSKAYLHSQEILFSSRWKNLKQNNMIGIISMQDFSIEKSKIVYALLNLLDDIDNYEESKKDNPQKEVKNIYVKGDNNTVIQGVKNTSINIGNSTDKTDFPRTRILFLASNPTNTAKLELAEEFRRIAERLQESGQFNKFELYHEWAVTPDKLQDSILKIKPHIVHFAGHGNKQDRGLLELLKELGIDLGDDTGLILTDANGKGKVVKTNALSNMFGLFSKQQDMKIEVVILNACYSALQAKEISKHIPFVIGMKNTIEQKSALLFSTGFYRGLANGKDIDFCYGLGRNLIDLEDMEDEDTVVLYKKL